VALLRLVLGPCSQVASWPKRSSLPLRGHHEQADATATMQ
jgi:hypothetical protein